MGGLFSVYRGRSTWTSVKRVVRGKEPSKTQQTSVVLHKGYSFTGSKAPEGATGLVCACALLGGELLRGGPYALAERPSKARASSIVAIPNNLRHTHTRIGFKPKWWIVRLAGAGSAVLAPTRTEAAGSRQCSFQSLESLTNI